MATGSTASAASPTVGGDPSNPAAPTGALAGKCNSHLSGHNRVIQCNSHSSGRNRLSQCNSHSSGRNRVSQCNSHLSGRNRVIQCNSHLTGCNRVSQRNSHLSGRNRVIQCNSHLSGSNILAAITPLLKKPGLDPDDPNHFRHISNLTFLSELLKRAVAAQLNQHLLNNKLYETFQSDFRTHHHIETALLKVTSAAFDTVNHSILLSRLQSIGITDTALCWFNSYLSGRSHYININNHTSPYK
ncbi:hypothetical protein ACEWY4_008566 [Coilia grayii]|uniref:Reverse transcriptase domain-containing protein n=1 Tax=Coilia grayii TaxID=363190 RepID=A0ABD1KBB6_9TELE